MNVKTVTAVHIVMNAAGKRREQNSQTEQGAYINASGSNKKSGINPWGTVMYEPEHSVRGYIWDHQMGPIL